MGAIPSVYVGPYAMWIGVNLPDGPEVEGILDQVFWGEWSADVAGEVEPGQGPVPVFFLSPHEDHPRPGGPKRAIRYSDTPPGGSTGGICVTSTGKRNWMHSNWLTKTNWMLWQNTLVVPRFCAGE